MNILCVIDDLGSGGAQRQLAGLAIAFKEKGHDVSFLVYHEGNFFKDILDKEGIPVVLIKEDNYLKRLLKMRRHIRKGSYHAVIAFLEAAAFICEVAGLPWRNWKLVVGERSANPKILRSTKLKFYRLCHVFADYIVANSYVNINIVKKVNPFLSEKKCKVIYNLIDLDFWKPAQDYMPLKNGKLNLIVAASHQCLKNAAGLIKGVARLKEQERKSLQISWYGDKTADNSYEVACLMVKEFHLESIISFYPATNQIRDKIQHADILGLFSFYEGFPNVVCEAMATGKTMILSNVSDIQVLFPEDVDFLFNPANSDQITTAISNVLKLSPADLIRMGQITRKRAMELFSKEMILEKYEKLLK